MKPIQGSLKQCLAHLAKTLKNDPDYYKKRKMVANALRMDDQTLHRWFKSGQALIGESLVCMMHYLDFLGYDVKEVRKMNPVLRDAGRLISFGVMTLAEMADFVGFQGKGTSNSSLLLAVLRGARGTSEEKLARFVLLNEQYAAELASKKLAVQKPFSFEESFAAMTEKDLVVHKEAIIRSFAQSVIALVPLAEGIVSDSFTAEDRERVRQLAQGDVSRLSFLLTCMSGEAARNVLSNVPDGGGTK